MSDPQVLEVAEWSRFEIHADDKLAGFVAYSPQPGRITFTHTQIDEGFEGRGLGSTLVRGALDAARARGLAVLPECPFVRGWIQKHADVVPESERARFGL